MQGTTLLTGTILHLRARERTHHEHFGSAAMIRTGWACVSSKVPIPPKRRSIEMSQPHSKPTNLSPEFPQKWTCSPRETRIGWRILFLRMISREFRPRMRPVPRKAKAFMGEAEKAKMLHQLNSAVHLQNRKRSRPTNGLSVELSRNSVNISLLLSATEKRFPNISV